MRRSGHGIQLSATDLVGHLNCRHLTSLDLAVAQGMLAKPASYDPFLEILRERGALHEQAYIDHLKNSGLDAVRIEGVDITVAAAGQTLDAMRAGTPVIIQGALLNGRWSGRTDVLFRVETPSALGSWSYEAVDTKLARETKGGTVLQLCLYSDLLADAQGLAPELMHVVPPWADFRPQQYRFADYGAFYRRAKSGLELTVDSATGSDTYPDPNSHCDVCRWSTQCDKQRRVDDHLCLVAGISKVQINELKTRGVGAMESLAAMLLPLQWKPERGSAHSYERIREQARLQVEARASGNLGFELLPVEAGFGLSCLPEPSDGDIFLDLEGDPFVGEHGLEYLFGYHFKNEAGEWSYVGDWAFSRTDEKLAFEAFIDFTTKRRETYPELHVYHYAPYEPGALKRLMGRYATREEEFDNMLRSKLFVDLYGVVRNGLRASVESYSIKRLEAFYGFTRETALQDANVALLSLQSSLELGHPDKIREQDRSVVESYNRDDCVSTQFLRDWLEMLRSGVIAAGENIARPQPGDEVASENVTAWLAKIGPLIEKLTADVPADPEERDAEQHARWILANILDWHRREAKATWWEFFRLRDLSAEELMEERSGLAGLTFVGEVPGVGKLPTHRYSFIPQETDIRVEDDLHNVGGDKIGSAVAVSQQNRTIDVKKTGKSVDVHPQAIYGSKNFGSDEQANSLVRIGEYVADRGLTGDGPYCAARDLLLRLAPRLRGEPIKTDKETTLAAAMRVATLLDGGVFPIQGPPGTGKSFTGARMICTLVGEGKTVGITANSHKVIRNLIDKVVEAADELGVDLTCIVKPKEVESNQHRLVFAKNNADVYGALSGPCKVAGGTSFLWSRADAFESIDVLVVDEAAQMSLANVLAVSQAAHTVVLLGDPQQLDQPMQGSHPDGTDVSALDHILAGGKTIAAGQGLFLEETWRLHPDICAFTSELFYEGKLKSKDGLDGQIVSSGPIQGSGMRHIPVSHSGNQNSSPEEAVVIRDLVNHIMQSKTRWIDRHGKEDAVTSDDILIITPYNAQVFEIQQHLPSARVGTVDKFQGQEAPIAIYSMATSTHADAPRGMEFLYSLNRFNVATSRAKCLSILVASPQVFEAECRTPRQIQLANAFCRYLEMCSLIQLPTSQQN
ncbi:MULTISPECIES: TM0106 family RecB-like putative nuclease [unclassified Mesorhizobium]|nr:MULTISPECIES: TM0106 family RecB-like putative nuclease [unclassified Mesorhizobium]TGQ72966.1 TM0106 family RecB-like putative nuclease [bacterium M00.F.Ca.ET.205.01.1.1]TGU53722.1 TM0106 family RecB-like putative nuclease [bacterium M00.F.Ca.ET.152.01.1.1]TGV37222.1 TM0106 family RecB-like putative nuclease [Mesorhizobium sp. M00.F.Ca.ET.186.01.1.1]TGZ39410.1 TM0106 family RecB-like putative nuclease [bacterium M00.F.Ca.ET.162.01.1.1]TGT92133.1 TM0106 family RecB-like putative nuclease [M